MSEFFIENLTYLVFALIILFLLLFIYLIRKYIKNQRSILKRISAVKKLGETVDIKAVPSLIATLQDSKEGHEVKTNALKTLGRIKDKSAIPALIVALTDHVPSVRSEAVKALASIHTPETESYLYQVLFEDPDFSVRASAAEALGMIADDQNITKAMKNFRDPYSIELLEKMGKKAIPFILEALKNGPYEIQVKAATALERLKFVEKEIEKLDSTEEKMAMEILTIIAKTGTVDTLIHSLNHPCLKIRVSLCRILQEISNAKILDALTALATTDSEWAVRLKAFSALAKLSNKKSLHVITNALQKEETMVREGLLSSLKNAALSFLNELWQPISSLLHDENISIRIHAADLLSKLSLPLLVPVFLDALKDPIIEVRKIAAESLGKLKGNNIVKPLIHALKDPSHEVRLAAVKSLGWIRDPASIEPLANSFEWADDDSRNEIAIALTSISKNFTELTDVLMGLTSPKARAGVVLSIGYLINNEKIIPLMTKFLNDQDPTVRAIAATSLGRLGSLSSRVRFALMEGLKDPNEWVRSSIIAVFRQHGDHSLIKMFISMLANETDENVCQNLVLAIGCLCDSLNTPSALSSIKKWMETSLHEKSQAAGFIALALLKNEKNFQKIYSATLSKSLHHHIGNFLKTLSKESQDQFFSFLSLDPDLFWFDEQDRSWTHYKNILSSSHEAEARIHAIHTLALLKEKSALPLIEKTFAKDQSPKVRKEALIAMNSLLEEKEIINKIGNAILDPSIEVRLHFLKILKKLKINDLKQSREKLIPFLDSPEKEIRTTTSHLLAHLYRHDWYLLADQLMGSNKKLQIIGLIEILCEIGDKNSFQFFIKFMKHLDPEIRGVASVVALKVNALSKDEWTFCLKDPEKTVRLSALHWFSKHLDSKNFDILCGLLEDPAVEIRKELSWLLGQQLFLEEKKAKEMLKHLSQDSHPIVQIVSLISLCNLGEKETTTNISHLLSMLKPLELELFYEELQKKNFFINLISTLRYNKDAAYRKNALQLLSALDFTHYRREILQSLQDPASEVRLAAFKALENSEEIQEAIELLSQDPVDAIREAVRLKKLQIKKQREVKSFNQVLDSENNDFNILDRSISRPSLYVVDPDTKFLELLQLEKEEFAIDLFVESNPEKAFSSLESKEFNPNIIVSSKTFNGSKITAFDLLDVIQKKQESMSPIFSIILEDNDSLNVRIDALKRGIKYIFQRPISAHVLLKAMTESFEIESLANYNVLILSDYSDSSQFISSSLSEIGILVKSVENPASLYKALDEYAPEILFLDIDFPTTASFNLLRTLRAEIIYQNLIIVIIASPKWSIEAEADTLHSYYSGNADEILYKPLNKTILQECAINLINRTTLLKIAITQSSMGLNILKNLLKDLHKILDSSSQVFSHLVLFQIDDYSELSLQQGQTAVNEFMISISNVLQRIEDSTISCYFFNSTFAILLKGYNSQVIEKKIFDLLTPLQLQSTLNVSFSCSIVPVSKDIGNSREIIHAAENTLKNALNQEKAPIKIASYLIQGAHSHKKLLVLVEPNEDLSLILKTAFESKDLTIKLFKAGKPALQELLNTNEMELPALIIVERKLPDMDGLEILKALNARFKSHIPFYFLTDFVAEKDVTEGLKYGALEYITKPFNLAHLVQKSNKIIFE